MKWSFAIIAGLVAGLFLNGEANAEILAGAYIFMPNGGKSFSCYNINTDEEKFRASPCYPPVLEFQKVGGFILNPNGLLMECSAKSECKPLVDVGQRQAPQWEPNTLDVWARTLEGWGKGT